MKLVILVMLVLSCSNEKVLRTEVESLKKLEITTPDDFALHLFEAMKVRKSLNYPAESIQYTEKLLMGGGGPVVKPFSTWRHYTF